MPASKSSFSRLNAHASALAARLAPPLIQTVTQILVPTLAMWASWTVAVKDNRDMLAVYQVQPLENRVRESATPLLRETASHVNDMTL